ncbi:UdgX family uracil-DNA binding protein [Novosphingobium sp.]|uniref:UdgX family uracil-DNA binding protein n=1 Tax=Novosphingobium sp. TaxID=1874826 RepID=UPI0025D0244A|nr:UdgX family uracil-DNA binding protein [Novosphingobium sp.]
MTQLFRDARIGDACVVALAAPDDFAGWREQARRLVMAEVPPDRVIWQVPGEGGGDLFAGPGNARRLPTPPRDAPPPRVPRAFLDLAGKAALHRDEQRHALLYRLLWRLQTRPGLMEDAADDDVRRLQMLARTVRRDIHKMRAFVRFRVIADTQGERYVAWFEPEHYILRANAAFFVNRFTQMQWTILTPQGSIDWDGETLREGPPAARSDAPAEDAAEDLWKTYYASIFNPARLKIGAMLKEMPKRYWKNMPEAALIPALVAGAQAREARMVETGAALFTEDRPDSLDAIAAGVSACTRCAIGCNGTRAVAGEGRDDAALMIVGEQPGDSEEQAGRPFIGPAGQVLRGHLEQAGIDPQQAWLTNAVKHFKFVMRAPAKRRLHQNPSAKEIDTCRWWVESERLLVRPRLVLALGASAARSVLGKTVSVQKVRGVPHRLDDGAELWITTHPSYLLRLDDAARAGEEARFAADLAAAQARLRELAG